jgi:hypothetical protein
MNMTAQRISPGSTIQLNQDPWLSVPRSAFALPRELALSYCIQFISAKGESPLLPLQFDFTLNNSVRQRGFALHQKYFI